MARGMANGEQIHSQANTKEYGERFDAIFGKDRKAKPGRYVFDEAQQKFVPAEEYVPPVEAKDAPIMAGRFYENLQSPVDGSDIGSRKRYLEHCKEKGITPISDYKEHLEKKTQERAKVLKGDFDHAQRREDVARAWYELENRKRR